MLSCAQIRPQARPQIAFYLCQLADADLCELDDQFVLLEARRARCRTLSGGRSTLFTLTTEFRDRFGGIARPPLPYSLDSILASG